MLEAAGLVWIGPPPAALRAGGDKVEAKRIARAAGVPVVETGEPALIGFPLLVKAAAGGGGRGMRVVRSRSELEPALAAARREAGAAFGDETVFCERYLEQARHVEVQLLADEHGTVLASASASARSSAATRSCSRSRPRRRSTGRSACGSTTARSASRGPIGYRGAGTAEFLVAAGEIFFLELNARIQVEHPVTELVTGRDLVADQIRIAVGEPRLGRAAASAGHAIEVRLYAEDPRTFLPQSGRIELLRLPEIGPGRRRRRGGRHDRDAATTR